MPPRLRHAFRFALPNLVAVLVAALAYELFEAYVRGDVPEGMSPGGAVAENMSVWALLALVVGVVTFLLRLSDVVARVPGWRFAWLGAAWVALACVLVVHAVEAGALGVSIGIGVAAVAIWIVIHRRIPGWPGAAARGADDAAAGGRAGQRHLP